jgi:hypothetical protein
MVQWFNRLPREVTMAQRWAMQKMDRNQDLRDRKAGRHDRFHGWTRSADALPGTGEEKEERIGRACPMPTSAEVKHAEAVALAACNLKVKHIACDGIMPPNVMGKTMRKARGGSVKLWSGTDGRKGNLPRIVRPTIKWADHPTVWPIIKKS